MNGKRNQGRRSSRSFVRLDLRLSQSETWRALSPWARLIFIELCSHTFKHPDGVRGSLRELADAVGCNKDTVPGCLAQLEEVGLIQTISRGGFSGTVERRASTFQVFGWPIPGRQDLEPDLTPARKNAVRAGRTQRLTGPDRLEGGKGSTSERAGQIGPVSGYQRPSGSDDLRSTMQGSAGTGRRALGDGHPSSPGSVPSGSVPSSGAGASVKDPVPAPPTHLEARRRQKAEQREREVGGGERSLLARLSIGPLEVADLSSDDLEEIDFLAAQGAVAIVGGVARRPDRRST